MNLLLYAVEKHRQSTREVYIYVTLNLLRSTGISEQSEFYYILCIGKKILVTPHIHICKMAPVLKIPLQHVLKLHVGYPYLLHRACVYQWKCLVRPYNIVRI